MILPEDGPISAPSHDAWIAKVKSELKGRELSSFDYHWDGDRISPFDDFTPVHRVLSNKKDNEWKIGVHLPEDAHASNRYLKKGLELGASSILLNVTPDNNWDSLLKDIHLDWIHAEYWLKDDHSFGTLAAHLKRYPAGSIRGVFWTESDQVDLFQNNYSLFPQFRFLSVIVNAADSATQIAFQFRNLIDRLSTLSEVFEQDLILSNVAVSFVAGEDLILNISLLRALRVLWIQVLHSLGIDLNLYAIQISGRVPYIYQVPGDQKIAASLMATSLVIGGVDTLFIDPVDALAPDPRWGLMTQHILKEEARLNKLPDPFAGSLVIENLTGRIAKKVWNLL